MIQVLANTVDITDQIEQSSLDVIQKLTNQSDSASFIVIYAGDKTYVPAYGDDIEIYDGTDKIFGGTVLSANSTPLSAVGGLKYTVKCVDHTYEMDKTLVAKTYENETVEDIIADLVSTYASGFTSTNASSTFVIEKIVFNQVPLSTCIKRLADIVSFDWYVDVNKDVHFFSKYSKAAPFSVTDTNGNCLTKTLRRTQDGSEVANRVKVRGGEYDGETFSDSITVSGNDSKSFKLPYRFANLTVTLNTVAQNVGIDFVDDFTSDDVLYNYQEQTIRWETALTEGDVIAFSGNPKIPVFAIASDPISIESYGQIEKLIRDDSIESNVTARKRANAELFTFSEPIVDVRFTTYTPGLHTGMVINVNSTIHGISEDLIVKQITFGMRGHDTFMYDVELVSTRRYDFVTLLQKIIEPDPRPIDESEVSEEIFTDTVNVSITDETDTVSPFEDTTQEIEVTENYELDPLGDDTDAEYVLAPYTPTGQTDPYRPGRLDISFVAY